MSAGRKDAGESTPGAATGLPAFALPPNVGGADAYRRIGTRISQWGSAAAIAGEALREIEARKAKRRKDPRPVIPADRILTEYQQFPVEFARDILGIKLLDEQQEKVLREYVKARELSQSSGNGIGKTFSIPIITWHTFLCWDNSLVILGSAVDRQIRINHWAAIRRIWNQAPYVLGEKPGKNHLTGHASPDDRRRIFGASPKQKEDVQGTRGGERTVILLDECTGIPDEVAAGYENLMTQANAFKLNLGNPTQDGWFREKFDKNDGSNPRIIAIQTSCLDTTNVKARKEIIPGLTSYEWVEERRRLYGENDPRWITSVLGRFLSAGEERIYSDDRIKGLFDPYCDFDAEKHLRIGIDLAGSGGDRTVVTYARGLRLFAREDCTGMQLEQLAIHVLGRIGSDEDAIITYDSTGLGGKFGRHFEGSRHTMVPVHFSQLADDRTTYRRARDEMPWHFLDWIKAGGKILLPPGSEAARMLKQEMEKSKFEWNLKRQIVVGEKYDLRKALGRSCDDFDSVCLCLYRWESSAAMLTRNLERKKREAGERFTKRTGFMYPGAGKSR